MNLGAFAGGVAAGLESGEKMRRERERSQRDKERHDADMEARNRQNEHAKMQDQAWVELNDLIRESSAARAGAQTARTPDFNPAAGAQSGGGMPTEQDTAQTFPLREPGLESATPAAAAEPTAVAAEPTAVAAPSPASAPAAEGLRPRAEMADPGRQVGFGLYQNTNLLRDPQFLDRAAQIFLKAKMPEGIKWLERSHAAQRENAVDALKALSAGDVNRAIETFNAAGRVKVEGAEQITEGPDKGKWAVRFEGGQQRTIDPAEELKSYLDPSAFFTLRDRDRTAAREDRRLTAFEGDLQARREDRNADNARRDRELTERERHNRAIEGLSRDRAGAGGQKPLTEKDYNTIQGRVQSQLRAQMRDTAPTDALGKKQRNPLSEFVPDITESIMKDVREGVDPAVAFNNRYAEAGERLDQATTVLGSVFDDAKKAGAGWLSGKADAVKSLRAGVEKLRDQGMTTEEIKRYAKVTRSGEDMKLLDEAMRGSEGKVVAKGPGLEPKPTQGPKNGDRRTVNGVTYEWKDGRPVPVQGGK